MYWSKFMICVAVQYRHNSFDNCDLGVERYKIRRLAGHLHRIKTIWSHSVVLNRLFFFNDNLIVLSGNLSVSTTTMTFLYKGTGMVQHSGSGVDLFGIVRLAGTHREKLV
jgi:hypothetical protein